MTHLPIISLKSDTYAVKSLAPGVGWVTVKVKYYPNPNDKSKYTVGTRRLRLVPTTNAVHTDAAEYALTISLSSPKNFFVSSLSLENTFNCGYIPS